MNEYFQAELRIFAQSPFPFSPWGYFFMPNMVRGKGLYCRKDKPAELSFFYGLVTTNGKMEKPKVRNQFFPPAICWILGGGRRQGMWWETSARSRKVHSGWHFPAFRQASNETLLGASSALQAYAWPSSTMCLSDFEWGRE